MKCKKEAAANMGLVPKENGMNWDEAISFVKRNSNLELWVKGRKWYLQFPKLPVVLPV